MKQQELRKLNMTMPKYSVNFIKGKLKFIFQIVSLTLTRNEPGGYDTIQEYWKDFTHVVQLTLHLKTSSSIQILLNLTGDFHDVFDEFNETKKSLDCQEYFEAMEFAWKSLIQTHKVDQTDKVRILNVLRDGQDRAAVLSLPSAYSHAIQMLSGE
jgi:hypothetical protein